MRKEALTQARALVESGHRTYICGALQQVGRRPGMSEVTSDLIDEIQHAISPYATLLEWVLHQRPPGTFKASQQHAHLARLAWLDKLILEES